jgi:hypothetical protein
VPLYAVSLLAKRIVPDRTPYVDLQYRQALALSTAYQGGIVAWVAFWAIYGQGLSAANLAGIATFGAAYMTVILLEPLADLGVLATAKLLRQLQGTRLIQQRVYNAAA